MISRKITLIVRGESEDDFSYAVESALSSILEGSIAGEGFTESSLYKFSMEDDPVPGQIPFANNLVAKIRQFTELFHFKKSFW